ncbi:MAG: succinate--CoA ligase subunit alpha [Deltaproteobacteria bacterium]|nr:succinate--CoA ligase subunit alpha [Deltaproteobacteria bacterium]
MSVCVDKSTKVVVQGITGREGNFHAFHCKEYGTQIVAGVTPGKEGEEVAGIPVFNTVKKAVEETGADASLIFVPPPFAMDAVLEAIDAGIRTIVCITEGIPIMDMVKIRMVVKAEGVTFIGPNTPGIITADEAKLGIMPGFIFKKGSVGIMSRSGTLLYEVVDQITKSGLGESTALGIGGDPVTGTDFIHWLKLFEEDPQTKAIFIIGEIGGMMEEDAAEFIKSNVKKPVFAFISGRTAPPGKRMGHAGAIIMGGRGSAETKIKALREAGVTVVENITEVGKTVKEKVGKG